MTSISIRFLNQTYHVTLEDLEYCTKFSDHFYDVSGQFLNFMELDSYWSQSTFLVWTKASQIFCETSQLAFEGTNIFMYFHLFESKLLLSDDW